MPDSDDFPPDTRQFIRRYLRSVEQLEILLLLHDHPETDWSVHSVYGVIKSSKPSVERWLNEFVQLGFAAVNAEAPDRYRFVANGEIAAEVSAFAEFYRLKPVRVIEAIFQRDHDPAQSFADAFRIKRGEQ